MDASLKARPLTRGRLITILVAIVVTLALAGAVWFFNYFGHYQPFDEGPLFGIKHADPLPIRAGGQNMDWFFESTMLRYEKNGYFAVTGIIENEGRFPVTVTKVFRGVQGGDFGLREVRFGNSLEEDKLSSNWRNYSLFEPFRLEPGENRLYAAIYDFKDHSCDHLNRGTGGAFGTDGFDVSYSSYGIDNRTTIPFSHDVNVLYPTRADCKGSRT